MNQKKRDSFSEVLGVTQVFPLNPNHLLFSKMMIWIESHHGLVNIAIKMFKAQGPSGRSFAFNQTECRYHCFQLPSHQPGSNTADLPAQGRSILK